MTILSDVKALGQQIWLDNLSRSLVQSGELAEMLKQGVCGVTSNPAIFQKAFAGDALYADEVAALKQQDLTPKQRYETMAVADVQAACDVCLAEHESTGGKTGFVSLEVSPELSKDAQGTVEEARRLHAAIVRKNAMIKVPATDEGIEALETLVSDGISVNLTLLFSRAQTLKAYAAYARGIAKRLEAGHDVSHIHVVASFFIPVSCRVGRYPARPPQRQNRHRAGQSRLSRLGAILRQQRICRTYRKRCQPRTTSVGIYRREKPCLS